MTARPAPSPASAPAAELDDVDRAADYLAAALGGTVLDPAERGADPAAVALAGWNRAVYSRAEVTAVWCVGAEFPACRARWLLDAIDDGRPVQWVAAYPRRRGQPWRAATAPTRDQLAAWAEPCPVLPWWWAPPGPAHPRGVCDCIERGPLHPRTPEPPAAAARVPAPAGAPAWTVHGHAVDLRGGVLTVDGRQVAAGVTLTDVTIYARRLFVGGQPVADLAA